ncbi:MAG: SET domain-containing protein [Planctomycetaceae bacterium]
MPIQPSVLIEVKRTRNKGRGVFAREFIAAGTVIERVPVLVIPEEEVYEAPGNPLLLDYVFEWGKGTVGLAALGFGSLYNHSYQPNARYDDEGRQTKVFTALRDISSGEEITINYNGHEDDASPVHFRVCETTAASPLRSLRGGGAGSLLRLRRSRQKSLCGEEVLPALNRRRSAVCGFHACCRRRSSGAAGARLLPESAGTHATVAGWRLLNGSDRSPGLANQGGSCAGGVELTTDGHRMLSGREICLAAFPTINRNSDSWRRWNKFAASPHRLSIPS